MKRFKWRLQRLLDVTIQRERALRSELFALSRRIARLHQEIFRRRTALRATLADLAQEDVQQRVPRQQVFMSHSPVAWKVLNELNVELTELTERRGQATERLMKARSSRRTLERLREEALEGHIRQEIKAEQKNLDETAHVSFPRRAAESPRAGGK